MLHVLKKPQICKVSSICLSPFMKEEEILEKLSFLSYRVSNWHMVR